MRHFARIGLLLLFSCLSSAAYAACDTQRAEFEKNAVAIRAVDLQTRPATAAAAGQYAVQRRTLLLRQSVLSRTLAERSCRLAFPDPTPPGSAPDVIIQVLACLPPGGTAEKQLTGYITAALTSSQQTQPDLFPNPSVQAACLAGRETVGIWRDQIGQAAALNGIDILSSRSAVVAIQMSPAAANALVGVEWGKYKIANTTGDRKYGDYEIGYDPSKNSATVTLHASARDVPNLDIWSDATIGLVDTLSTSGEAPSCSHQTTFDFDINGAAALLGFLMPMPVGGALIDAIQDGFNSEGDNDRSDPSLTNSGLGCQFAAFVPTSILTPRDSTTNPPTPPGKIVIGYDKVSVSSADGMTFYSDSLADIPHSVPRQPQIIGDGAFIARVYLQDVDNPVSARWGVFLSDLRPDSTHPIEVTWKMTKGKVQSYQNGGLDAIVSFGALPAGPHSAGKFFDLGTVTVSAVDADGVTATQSFPAQALIIPNPGAPETPDLHTPLSH